MSEDNVIWGVTWHPAYIQADKEKTELSRAMLDKLWADTAQSDTSPSEYTPPADDCA